MIIDLSDKNIMVTGTSSGLGLQLAKDIAKSGANVYGLARKTAKEPLSENIIQNEFDLTDLNSIPDFVSNMPQVDGLVLNAGAYELKPLRSSKWHSSMKLISLNLESNIVLLSEISRQRKLNKGGSVVAISSISAHFGVLGTGAYAASKAGLGAFIKVAASELAASKIRANIVLPGTLRTGVSQKTDVLTSESLNLLESRYPLGLGEASQVSNLCVFLLSDLSSWITGSEIVIDGGYSLNR